MHLTRKLPFTLAILTLSTAAAMAQSAGRLANISSRVYCQTRDAVIVTEFIAYGSGNESFVLRGIGPSLAEFGIPDPLQDPTLRLLDVRGNKLDHNDNWMDNPDKDEIENVALAPTNDLESAIIDTVGPGIYTSVVQGNHHGEGTALSELFDLFDGDLQLSAVGTRGFVGTDDEALISGVIVTGNEPLSLLVRGIGPSLTDAGLPDALANPTLELFLSNGDLIFNDNWREGGQEAEIIASGLAPANDLESAVLVTVNPGAYTTVVKGLGGGTGLGFVQWYSLDAPIRELKPAPLLRRGQYELLSVLRTLIVEPESPGRVPETLREGRRSARPGSAPSASL
jgi:hypothetical protein